MKAMGWGEARGSLKSKHADDAVDDIISEFIITFLVGHSTLFEQAGWGSPFSWGVSAWNWGWGWG